MRTAYNCDPLSHPWHKHIKLLFIVLISYSLSFKAYSWLRRLEESRSESRMFVRTSETAERAWCKVWPPPAGPGARVHGRVCSAPHKGQRFRQRAPKPSHEGLMAEGDPSAPSRVSCLRCIARPLQELPPQLCTLHPISHSAQSTLPLLPPTRITCCAWPSVGFAPDYFGCNTTGLDIHK